MYDFILSGFVSIDMRRVIAHSFYFLPFFPNRRDVQITQLRELESHFSTSKAEVCRVQERVKALEIAMQMAREVCRVPCLEQYCTLDKV